MMGNRIKIFKRVIIVLVVSCILFGCLVVFELCHLIFRHKIQAHPAFNLRNDYLVASLTLDNYFSVKHGTENRSTYYFCGKFSYTFTNNFPGVKTFYLQDSHQRYEMQVDSIGSVLFFWDGDQLALGVEQETEVCAIFEHRDLNFQEMQLVFDNIMYISP